METHLKLLKKLFWPQSGHIKLSHFRLTPKSWFKVAFSLRMIKRSYRLTPKIGSGAITPLRPILGLEDGNQAQPQRSSDAGCGPCAHSLSPMLRGGTWQWSHFAPLQPVYNEVKCLCHHPNPLHTRLAEHGKACMQLRQHAEGWQDGCRRSKWSYNVAAKWRQGHKIRLLSYRIGL